MSGGGGGSNRRQVEKQFEYDTANHNYEWDQMQIDNAYKQDI